MNCCINGVVELFKNNSCAATTLAVAAFVLGAVFTCLLCAIRRACGGKPCTCAKKAEAKKSGDKKPEEKPFIKRSPHPAPADGSVEIYAGNLSYDMTDDMLRKEFEAYGTVSMCRVVMNRYNGKSKGFGFVQMPNRAEAEKAIAALNDKDILGRKLRCNEAKNLV